MKTIKGICIKKRNFDKFKKVADLIYFDGPLLSHYVTNKGDNYLFYWIDQDDTNNRWMFIRTDYDNIQKYTNKKQTLRNVLSSPLDDIVYTVDIDEEGNHHNFQAHSIEDLPEDYLPTEDSYSSNPQPIGFSGILLAKRQNSFYCTYFLHNRNVADTKSPYPIKRLEVIRWFNQKSMVFNQSLS